MLFRRLGSFNGHFNRRNIFSSSIRSFSDKVEEVSASQVNKFVSGVHLNPHIAKRAKGGEDAVSLTDNMISVADGVGGWAESGIDPAIFARRLCNNIEKLAIAADDVQLMNPTRFMIDAVADNNHTGSSTCIILTLDKVAPVLYTANLGDSGYMLLRKSGLDLVQVYRSKEQ
jgi:protein phosphatase PTC7